MSIPAPAPPPEAPSSRTSARIASGTPQGRQERLYAANLGLAGKVLSRFPSLTLDAREDAHSAARRGLWRACQRFDPGRGVTFSTYASDCIRNAVLSHLTHRQRQERLAAVSLETPLGDDGGELADLVEDAGAEKPGQVLLNRAGFDALLAGLPRRQQEVLRAVYEEERPLSEIAEGMGVTKQRAGQIHLQALAALRKAVSGKPCQLD